MIANYIIRDIKVEKQTKLQIMSSTTVAGLTDTAMTNIGDTIISVMPAILLVVAGLIGFFFAWRFVKKQIGKGK